MKHISKLLFAATLITAFAACKKIGPLPFYANGTAPVLTSSSTDITPAPSDSNKVVATFSWTNTKYATDSATQKFILEIDSTGRKFSKEVTRVVSGSLGISFTGQQLNDILASFGFAPGQTFTFDIRVTSSYANNNEQLWSNVITVKITSYLVPITLVPSSTSAVVLQVNNATSEAISFNWNSSTYGANVINYALQLDTAGGNFAHPQVIKYDKALTSTITVSDLNSMAITAGVSGGSTKNIEFRIVSYLGTDYTTPLVYSNAVPISITTFTPIPPVLFIIGDATPLGWNNNPGLAPTQQFTRIDAVSYGIVINLTAGKSYLFLPEDHNLWSHKYGGASATGGALLADGAVPGSNTPAPATSGTYQIIVNFQTGTYTVTSVTTAIPPVLFIIGDATPLGWNNNPGLSPTQQFTRIDAVSYGIVVNLTAGKSYLFLPEDQGLWSHKYGGTSATGGTLLADGAVPGSNTPAPAATGNYQIIVNFQTGTYTVTPYTGVLPIPPVLFIIGDATPLGWTNSPGLSPTQQFTQVSLTDFQIIVPLTAGKSYLFLPEDQNLWTHKYGGTSATGGAILYDGAVPGSNTPAPGVDGNYLIDVDFAAGQYTVTKQ
jgi:starch-binding outer membrane protein SusE/F